jgi:hypothetical protein
MRNEEEEEEVLCRCGNWSPVTKGKEIRSRIQVEVFWVVTFRKVVVGYQRFGGPCCLHLQDELTGDGKKGCLTTGYGRKYLELRDRKK